MIGILSKTNLINCCIELLKEFPNITTLCLAEEKYESTGELFLVIDTGIVDKWGESDCM